jgi:hypothetical protein
MDRNTEIKETTIGTSSSLLNKKEGIRRDV